MKKMKEKLGKILVLIIACLSVGMIASAANSTATEVQIAIEASETTVEDDGKDEGRVEDTDNNRPADTDNSQRTEEDSSQHVEAENNQRVKEVEQVQTGDASNTWVYILVAGIAIALISICIFRENKKILMSVMALFLTMFFMNNSAHAAEDTGNVNVTVPSSIAVSFDKTGENSISEFAIDNHLPVPVTIDKVTVTECNDWKLCSAGEDIPVNTKMMAFTFEDQCLKAEENTLDITIAEGSSKDCSIHIDRGAWTTAGTAEKALQLEFEYAVGRKQFQLSFDTNGGTPEIPTQMVYNEDIISLPSVEKDGYALVGWEDSDGNLYTDQFTMPMKDVILTAKWKEKIVYAIYVEDDLSLRFIRTADTITAGSIYNDMTVAAVYTGFENTTYNSVNEVPWYDGNYYNQKNIKRVIVEDEIRPANTAYWFMNMDECEYVDVTKMDTSRVTNMTYMFAWTGFGVSDFTLIGADGFDVSNVTNMAYTFAYAGRDAASVVVDLSKWNVSKVTDMDHMFTAMGYFSSTFGLGDLSGWNVSNVTNMYKMFQHTGGYANWYLDCSKWNVSKVTSANNFNYDVESKVIAPTWAY